MYTILYYLGAGLKLAHINKAECSGKFQYQELKPIERNLHYDFNFQQATHLPQPITIQPVYIYLYTHILSVIIIGR